MAVKDWTRTKRSRKLYLSANYARHRVRRLKWRRAQTADTISTWPAWRWTRKCQNGTFVRSAVLRGKNRCGKRSVGFNRSRNRWLRSCRNWYQRRRRRRRRRRSTQSVTENSAHVTGTICRRMRNLNIRFKINSWLYIAKYSSRIMRRSDRSQNRIRKFPETKLLTSCRLKTSFPPSGRNSKASSTTSPKTSAKPSFTFPWYHFYYYLELLSHWWDLLLHALLSPQNLLERYFRQKQNW